MEMLSSPFGMKEAYGTGHQEFKKKKKSPNKPTGSLQGGGGRKSTSLNPSELQL